MAPKAVEKSTTAVQKAAKAAPHMPVVAAANTAPKTSATTSRMRLPKWCSLTTFAFGFAALYILSMVNSVRHLFQPDVSPAVGERLFSPKWSEEQLFDLRVYVSSAQLQPDAKWLKRQLVIEEKGLSFTSEQEWNITIPLRGGSSNNATLYVHTIFTRAGLPVLLPDKRFNPELVYTLGEITRFLPFQENATRNLLQTEDDLPVDTQAAAQDGPVGKFGTKRIVAFHKKRLPIRLVACWLTFPGSKFPGDVGSMLRIDPDRSMWGPATFLDETWLRTEDYSVINRSTTALPLRVTFAPISLGWWRLSVAMSNAFKLLDQIGGADETETDQMKQMFADTNPTLLAVTMVVSVFHMVFDFLAFKNEIAFWRGKESYEGFSGNTMAMNFVCQSVIFLYLMDQDSSKLVLLSAFLSLLIELWKLTRIFRLSFTFSGIKRAAPRQSEASTQEFDKKALRYLSIAIVPIVIGYAVYSLLYSSHKSWYSWALGSFASAMYAGGFVLMTPQLFINYKLKSVAHLPWRVFIYKALNTFIDDLFAFIITMPTLHRMSVFRDDVVFFIYLYQRWIYPVDKSRAEFGAEEDDEPAAVTTKQGEKAKVS